MDSIWAALIGVGGTGLLSLLGAILMGKLVPSSRVRDAEAAGRQAVADLRVMHEKEIAAATVRAEKAEKAAETWRESNDAYKSTVDRQAALIERQQLTAEVTDKAMTAVREMLALPRPGGGST